MGDSIFTLKLVSQTNNAMQSKHINYLSCDNVDDAIRSLALAYETDDREVYQVYHAGWPDFLDKDVENDFFKNERVTWIMSQHMKCDDIKNRDRLTAHYHRSIYDGSENWYQGGLMSSICGAEAFLMKLRSKLSPECNFETIRTLAIANIVDRTNQEPEWGGGPYAFDRLDDAKNAQISGRDYSTPEFLLGRSWRYLAEKNCNVDMLIEICQKNFAPVVVKFLAKPSSIEQYINNLWHYLHCKRFQIELEPNHYTFLGYGRTVKHDQIVKLISNF